LACRVRRRPAAETPGRMQEARSGERQTGKASAGPSVSHDCGRTYRAALPFSSSTSTSSTIPLSPVWFIHFSRTVPSYLWANRSLAFVACTNPVLDLFWWQMNFEALFFLIWAPCVIIMDYHLLLHLGQLQCLCPTSSPYCSVYVRVNVRVPMLPCCSSPVWTCIDRARTPALITRGTHVQTDAIVRSSCVPALATAANWKTLRFSPPLSSVGEQG
jgi:hypothetical protein